MIIDIGEARDIHPKNKQDVGRRLGLAAQRLVYGQDVASSGPVLTGMDVDGARLRLHFAAHGQLVAKGDKLGGFAIAGEDHQWAWADGAIEGADVVVSTAQVPKPVAVRYGWANNPAASNLSDESGLPACPFRTDDWPGVTVNNK